MALLESVNITFSVEPVLWIESTAIFRACTSAVKIEASFGRVAGHEVDSVTASDPTPFVDLDPSVQIFL